MGACLKDGVHDLANGFQEEYASVMASTTLLGTKMLRLKAKGGQNRRQIP